VKLIVFILIILFAITIQPAYADNCRNTNGNVSINGTPQPELHNCPIHVDSNNSESHIEVRVNSNSKPDTIHEKEIITVIVTATPIPSPTGKVYPSYNPVNVVHPTPSPTLIQTATPSATIVPTTSKRTALKTRTTES